MNPLSKKAKVMEAESHGYVTEQTAAEMLGYKAGGNIRQKCNQLLIRSIRVANCNMYCYSDIMARRNGYDEFIDKQTAPQQELKLESLPAKEPAAPEPRRYTAEEVSAILCDLCRAGFAVDDDNLNYHMVNGTKVYCFASEWRSKCQ